MLRFAPLRGSVLLGAFALMVLAGAAGCGGEKPGPAIGGTGGNGTVGPGSGGAGPAAGSGGASGVPTPNGLQFNGSITFVRVQR